MNKPRLKDVNYLPCGQVASRVKERYKPKYDSNTQSLSTTLHDLPAIILIIKGHSRNANPDLKRPVLHQSLAISSSWHALNLSKEQTLFLSPGHSPLLLAAWGLKVRRKITSHDRTPSMDEIPRWVRPTWSLFTLEWWKWADAQRKTHSLLKWDSRFYSKHLL